MLVPVIGLERVVDGEDSLQWALDGWYASGRVEFACMTRLLRRVFLTQGHVI